MIQEDLFPDNAQGDETDTKYCIHCGCTLVPNINFNESNLKHSKYQCKDCRREYDQTAAPKFRDMKRKAKTRGYEFTLTLEDTSGLLLQTCYYCGKPSQEKIKLNGLDRINNNKGYIKDNVVTCCYDCNIAKAGQTQEEFIEMCKRVAQRHTTHEKSNLECRKVYLKDSEVGEIKQQDFRFPIW